MRAQRFEEMVLWNERVQRSECEIHECLSLIGWRKVMALCRPASDERRER